MSAGMDFADIYGNPAFTRHAKDLPKELSASAVLVIILVSAAHGHTHVGACACGPRWKEATARVDATFVRSRVSR